MDIEPGLKAVIFDFGGVLVRTYDWTPRTTWEQKLGLRRGQAEEIVFGVDTDYACQLGRISEVDHWRQLGARLGLGDEALAQFRTDFFSCDRLDTDLAAYIRRLRSRFHTGLLSNADTGARLRIEGTPELASAFDSITISAEEGIMKPAEAIFQIALARAGAGPQEAVFVDDVLANVEAARRIGMRAVHFTDPAIAREQLVALTAIE